MNVYAVAYSSLLENNLTIQFIEAEDEIEAAQKRVKEEGWEFQATTYEELAEEAFNVDVLLAVELIELEMDEHGEMRPKVTALESDEE